MPVEAPATQRELLEQNTALTRLIYNTVGELTQKMNDGFTELRTHLARLEGKAEGKAEVAHNRATKDNIRTSKWVRYSIGVSVLLSLLNMVHTFHLA